MKDIIAIIDKRSVESSTESTDTNDLLKHYRNQLIQEPKGTYKSIIITKDGIYFSPFTSNTIKRRSERSVRLLSK